MEVLSVGALAAPALLILLVVYLLLSLVAKNKEIHKEREDSTRRIYELAILKELGDRAGYSLNVEEILQIITGSLRQFIDYTAVGYVVITPEKVKINTNVEKSVSHEFVKDMKERMMASISALTGKDFKDMVIDEMVSGALVIDEIKEKIGSFFNIPLVIGGEVVGVLTVAHVDVGLYKEADMTILYKITGQASEAVSRLQEVVKMEQGKLNAMVESMGDGVLMVDTEYRVMVANPSVKKIIKFGNEKAITIFDFVDSLGGKFDIHGRLEEALSKKNSYLSEKININDSFFEIGVYPVAHSSLKGGAQILGAVVVFRDITRDIELEQVREEFTSMIVHELRSPLDGIKKIMELLVGGNSNLNPDQSKEYLNMAHQSTSSMLELVNDILDLSKLQAGKFEVNKERSSLKEVIENRIAFYKISSDARHVSLESYLHPSLPELSEFDPQAIKQILNNFLSNALKFTSANGKILVSAFVLDKDAGFPGDLMQNISEKAYVFPEAKDIKISQNSLCIVVSDSGIGIKSSDLPELFHTFKQAKISPVDKESKGTGLGLVIAKGIAEAHQGSVGVVSREGAGTSFFFTIPM